MRGSAQGCEGLGGSPVRGSGAVKGEWGCADRARL